MFRAVRVCRDVQGVQGCSGMCRVFGAVADVQDKTTCSGIVGRSERLGYLCTGSLSIERLSLKS